MIRIFFRKVVPIIVTLAVLVGGFLVYNHFQPKASVSTGEGDHGMPADTQPFPTEGPSVVSPGKVPWETGYDKVTGRRISRFKADFFDPRGDGTWYVTKPVVELFQARGQVLQIKGANGVIHVAPGTDKGVMQGAPPGPPRDGDLHDVVIKLYNTEADEANDLPQMTLAMPNAQFDYDTNRLFTQQYTDKQTGAVVHQDEVPVTIRGKDYDFDGTGLVIFWDDPQKQLKSLEIAHGQKLVIHNPSALSISPDAPPTPLAPTNNESKVASPPVTPPKPQPPDTSSSKQRYSATFIDNVRVVQGSEELVRAQQMKVDFIMKEGAASPPGTASPTPPSTAAPAPATDSQTPAPPVTPAAPQPITITWTGPLRIVPTDNPATEPLMPGQSIVQLTGSPVLVHQKGDTAAQAGTDIQSASLIYRSVDGSVRLDEGPGVPLTITQKQPGGAEGSVIHAQRLVYSRADRTANLDGNVDVKDPRLHLTSSHMALLLDSSKKPTAASANAMDTTELREMDATGDVKCVVPDDKGLPRSIESQRLHVLTDHDRDGKMYAKTIVADGAVHARQEDQELTADHLAADLEPSYKPRTPKKSPAASPNSFDTGNVDLKNLLASGSVTVTGRDGSSATGKTLQITPVDGHPHLTLTGDPDATVVNKGSALTAPVIHGLPDDQRYFADGPGKMNLVQQPTDPSKKPQPMKVTFDKGVQFDANANNIVVTGNVKVDTVSPDGTLSGANAEEVVLVLADKPAAEKPDPSKPAKTPATGDDMNFMQNKQLTMIRMLDGAKVASELSDGGVLLKRNTLEAQEIDEDPIHRRLTVPGPGRMLSENHQAPTTQPQKPAKDDAKDAGDMGGRGETAFQWEKQMNYDESARQATMDGKVWIVHTDDGPHPRNISIHGDHLIADLEPMPAATMPSSPLADDHTPQMRVTHVTIKGHTDVMAGDLKILAGILQYNPVTEEMAISAGDERECKMYDDLHRVGSSFSEATLNTRTNTLEHMRDVTVHTGE